MMSANVKANIKQQEIKDLVAVSYIFFKKYPQSLKYNRGCIFHLIFVGIPSILILFVNNRGMGWAGFCLMDKIC